MANTILRWVSFGLIAAFIGVMILGQKNWNHNIQQQAVFGAGPGAGQPGQGATGQQSPSSLPAQSQSQTQSPKSTAKPDKLVPATDVNWLFTNGAWSQATEAGWGEVKRSSMVGRKAHIMTNSPSANLKQRGIGGTITVTVDGKTAVSRPLPADGSTVDIPLYAQALASAWHTIDIAYSNMSELGGLWIEQGAELKRPASPYTRKLVVLGHSYVEGGNASDWGLTSFTSRLGELLGVETVNQGIAGTDVSVNSAKDLLNSGLNRVSKDVVAEKPDYVLVVYGLNNIPADGKKVQADFTALLTALRKELPSATLFVSGIASIPSLSDKQLQPYNASIQNAVKATAGAVFIDMAGAWNESNYSRYLSSDKVLPNDEGHQFLADKYAAAIKPYVK